MPCHFATSKLAFTCSATMMPMRRVSSLEFLAAEGPLEHAARASDAVAARWAHALTLQDRQALITGFFMAESLAGIALEQARTQLPPLYHAGLEAQAADEARHIEVFARWLGSPPSLPLPKLRQRQHIQWLMVLLVNELTGFCQFHSWPVCWKSRKPFQQCKRSPPKSGSM